MPAPPPLARCPAAAAPTPPAQPPWAPTSPEPPERPAPASPAQPNSRSPAAAPETLRTGSGRPGSGCAITMFEARLRITRRRTTTRPRIRSGLGGRHPRLPRSRRPELRRSRLGRAGSMCTVAVVLPMRRCRFTGGSRAEGRREAGNRGRLFGARAAQKTGRGGRGGVLRPRSPHRRNAFRYR